MNHLLFPWNIFIIKITNPHPLPKKERTTDKLWLLRHAHFTVIFLKINEVSLSRQGKLIVCFAKDKIRSGKWKLEFQKTCLHTMSFTASWYLKTLLMTSAVILRNVILWIKMCLHWENLQSPSHYFPNDQCMMSQPWAKEPFKV